MTEIIIQYGLIAILVVGLGYVMYLLKDKGVQLKEDYFGIAYTLLSGLEDSDVKPETVKGILRTVSKAVHYVEENYTDDENYIKEDKALGIINEELKATSLESKIDDENIRYIIRICSAFLPPTNKV